MDFGYVMKRMFGMVTPEEEQAHRAKMAAEQTAQLRAAPVVAPQIMPQTVLPERQQLLDSALQELQQQGLRGRVNGGMPTVPTIKPEKRPPNWIGVRS